MTTYLIYSAPTDGHILSRHANYNTARNGLGTKTVVVNDVDIHTGQSNRNGENYVYESFFTFDTSVIGDNEEIVDAVMSVHSKWTRNRHANEWYHYFFEHNWTAPLTAGQWVDPDSLNIYTSSLHSYVYGPAATPYQNRYSGADYLVKAINKDAPTQFVSLASNTLAGRNFIGGDSEIWVDGGETVTKPCLIVHTVNRSALNSVELASTTMDDGTTISVISDGAPEPTWWIERTPIGATTPLFLGEVSDRFERNISGRNAIAITHDPEGNFYLVGLWDVTDANIAAQAYVKTGASTWVPKTPLRQVIPEATRQRLRSFAAVYMKGTGPSDKPSIRIITARGASNTYKMPEHVSGAGWAQDTGLNVQSLRNGQGTLITETVDGLAYIPSTGIPAFVDAVAMSPNLCAFYVQHGKFGNAEVGGYMVLTVIDGRGSVRGNWNDDFIPNVGRSKLVAISERTFCHVYESNGELFVTFRNTACQLLGTTSIPASNFFGSNIGTQWTVNYDKTSNLVRIHFISGTNTRTLSRLDVSPSTFQPVITANVTTTLGEVGAVNSILRSSDTADERRVAIDTASLLQGNSSIATYYSTVGNFVPAAPAVAVRDNFDATNAVDFKWVFSDTNVKDTQEAYQLEISRVSDGVVVYDTGAMYTDRSYHTLPANTLTNAIDYRWRVRTVDAVNAFGTWSDYQQFTTSATGTTTITNPSVDNETGIDVADVPIQWSYVQSAGRTQAQRRVVVTRVADAITVHDTGMQASTDNTYIVPNLTSGLEYLVSVTVINSDGIQAPAATRLITSQYSEPMTPTLEITIGRESIDLLVVNPIPSGDRPEVVLNEIYKRRSRALATESDFVRIATVNNNGSYRDFAVKSDTAYDYKIVSYTGDN